MMIKVFLADNQPVVRYGVKSFFEGHSEIKISDTASNFEEVTSTLPKKNFDILVIDLELEGLASINYIKSLIKDYPKVKFIIYSNLSEQMFAPNALKTGVSAYVHKNAELQALESAILKVNEGEIVYSDLVKKNLALITKQRKNERLYRKLSTREIEVLRYLSEGRKNKEIAKTLDLNEKTISTYKLRLLTKLHVTNLVDLVNKAKTLDIV